jgi:hypothetical protein
VGSYIIYAPSYDPNNGGSIFLHELAQALRSLGEDALIWPMAPIYKPGLRARIRTFIRPSRFDRRPGDDVRLATRRDLRADSIVVYPEIVPGNPIGARNVVRWLLYPPGVLHPYRFEPGEMFFRASQMADLPDVTGGAPELFLWKVNAAYRNEGRTDRKGACFMVRKGINRPRIPETSGGEQIDGKSHEEINEIFNRCEIFYSYDEATMYSQYAAVAGCLSVVIPGMFRSRQDWVQEHELARFGIAYGLEDVEHARATRHLVEGLLREKEAEGRRSVERFVELTRSRFAKP